MPGRQVCMPTLCALTALWLRAEIYRSKLTLPKLHHSWLEYTGQTAQSFPCILMELCLLFNEAITIMILSSYSTRSRALFGLSRFTELAGGFKGASLATFKIGKGEETNLSMVFQKILKNCSNDFSGVGNMILLPRDSSFCHLML